MKTLHIIPHTHWDREWYMPLEHHRYRLVELFDTLIDVFQKDPNYQTFHMDGQCLPVLDYLEIKPQNKAIILDLIEKDKIHIGPFYILQDEYLISGEANVRNIIYGLKTVKALKGTPLMTGYFPDSFGNIAQMPQLLKGFDIPTSVFGRGMNEVGFNNTVLSKTMTNTSEVNWQAPDGSTVPSVFLANWYCNANDLPKDNPAKTFMDIYEHAQPFSYLDDLLGMNGCDHNPVQTNLSQLIQDANDQLSGKLTVKHSNFKDYLSIVEKHQDRYQYIQGELNGQYTTGYHLLINTASSRIDLKQLNYQAQRALEKSVEPLSVLSHLYTGKYDKDYIDYAWKTLLENHPHDSICACSTDAVHAEMVTRFNKVLQSADVIANETVHALTKNLNADALSGKGVIVFNPTHQALNDIVTTYVDFPQDTSIDGIQVKTLQGDVLPCEYDIQPNTFTYTLPKDQFRQTDTVTRVTISFLAKDVPALGYQVYDVLPSHDNKTHPTSSHTTTLDNTFSSVTIKDDGSFYLTDKTTKSTIGPLNYFEYTSDCGNEYNYAQCDNTSPITTKNTNAVISKTHHTSLKDSVRISHTVVVPKGLKDKKPTTDTVEIPITTTVSLHHHAPGVSIKTIIDNKAENIRIRALFDHDITTTQVYAEGQYTITPRPITPWEGWTNKDNPQRHHGYVYLTDAKKGMLLSGRGLHEHEVLRYQNNTLGLTLLRGVGELGDWGYFPTPDSQMKREHTVEYYVSHFSKDTLYTAQTQAQTFHDRPLSAYPIGQAKGTVPLSVSLFNTHDNRISTTALKAHETKAGYIYRAYNKTAETITISFNVHPSIEQIAITNLAETKTIPLTIKQGAITVTFNPHEIKTLYFTTLHPQ